MFRAKIHGSFKRHNVSFKIDMPTIILFELTSLVGHKYCVSTMKLLIFQGYEIIVHGGILMKW